MPRSKCLDVFAQLKLDGEPPSSRFGPPLKLFAGPDEGYSFSLLALFSLPKFIHFRIPDCFSIFCSYALSSVLYFSPSSLSLFL